MFKEVRELRLWHFNNWRLGFKLNFKKNEAILSQNHYFLKKQYGNIRWKHISIFHKCLAFCKYFWKKNKPVCKKPHMCILADVWLLPNMFGKNQTRWYIYTWVLFSTHVWILTHRYGKRHTCVQKATQLYVCKCLAFSTHVWEKPLTCLFPPELWVYSQTWYWYWVAPNTF